MTSMSTSTIVHQVEERTFGRRFPFSTYLDKTPKLPWGRMSYYRRGGARQSQLTPALSDPTTSRVDEVKDRKGSDYHHGHISVSVLRNNRQKHSYTSEEGEEGERQDLVMPLDEDPDPGQDKISLKRMMEKGIRLRRLNSDMAAAKVESVTQRSRYGVYHALHRTDSQLVSSMAAADDKMKLTREEEEKEIGKDITTLDELQDADLSETLLGKNVSMKVRLHGMRCLSSNLAFLILRHQTTTVQGVLRADGASITRHMVRWAERLPLESIVAIKGTLQRPSQTIRSASVRNVEILLTEFFIVNEPKMTPLPFNNNLVVTVDQDGNSTEQTRSLALRMANRTLDLRSPSSQAIFRIQSAVCRQFRDFLFHHSFMEIHTPKLIGGASESGASVFHVDYFGRNACLAQSPQLFKQMCICADFGRVFEVGPVFRAENSNTHRHLTEYTGLDLEMELTTDNYHEVMLLIDALLKSIFDVLINKHHRDLDAVRRAFPHKDLVWLPQTPILPYWHGIELLVESGYVEEDGSIPQASEDLTTRAEMRLGALIKDKYKTDYYILDKFPSRVRPFYTMPDEEHVGYSNSFDIFIRGQEIISGSQRIHLSEHLLENLAKLKLDGKGLEEYLDSFRLAAPAHAGCGIGLERFVMLFLGLGDIRNASLFPRDPKSLKLQTLPADKLRHPEASTNPRTKSKKSSSSSPKSTTSSPNGANEGKEYNWQLPTLEKLIANYGDSSNTSWLDDRFQTWQDAECGAMIGFVPVEKSRVIVVGNPLCEENQLVRIVKRFLDEMHSRKWKVVWLLVSTQVETILSEHHGWNSLSCVAESRVKGSKGSQTWHKDLDTKLRASLKAGLKTTVYGLHETVPDDVKAKCNEKIEAWIHHRKGKQVHLTNVRPWQDEEHRTYYITTDGKGDICALVILAQLSVEHGHQIKWALDFPSAPSGAIEYAIVEAIKANAGVDLTFGASAVSDMIIGKNIKGVRGKALESTYRGLVNNLHLLNKVEFRKKFGCVQDDRLWICFPKSTMGPSTIRAIVSFFGAS